MAKLSRQLRVRLLSCILLVILTPFDSLAHKEVVHVNLAIEAYELLRMQYPVIENTSMNTYVGPDPWVGCDLLPWSSGFITTGAYREDCEDPAWNHGEIFGVHPSATHFWDADAGDGSRINLCIPTCYDYENAYETALRYVNGGFPFMMSTQLRSPTGQFPLELVAFGGPLNGHVARFVNTIGQTSFYFSYSSLVQLFQTGVVTCETADYAWWPGLEAWGSVYNEQFVLSADVRQRLAFTFLGRIAHLLGDMSVPAHAHNDPHPPNILGFGNPDLYEDFMGTHFTDCFSDPPYPGLTCWDAVNAGRQGPLLDGYDAIPSQQAQRIIRYLFYCVNQVADRFPSNDVNGDPSYSTSYYEDDYSVLNIIQEITHPLTAGSVEPYEVNKYAFRFVIRAIAGLYYWFAAETGLIRRIVVKNDFNGSDVTVNFQSYPSGTTFSFPEFATLVVSTETPQTYGGYGRFFSKWLRLNPDGTQSGTNNTVTWNTWVSGNHTYVARFNREFNIALADAQYIEQGGSGGMYRVNSGAPVLTWSGTFIENVSSPILLEAPPSGEWMFAEWSDNHPDKYANPRNFTPPGHTTLSATFKKHLASNSTIATATNNQRKIAQSEQGVFCLVYESGNRIWFTRSNDAVNWSPEVCISNGVAGTDNHKYPSIVVKSEVANIVWQHQSGYGAFGEGKIFLRRYAIGLDSWGTTQQIGIFNDYPEDFALTPVIAAHYLSVDGTQDIKMVAWNDPYGIKIRSNDNGTWGSVGTVPGTHSNCYYPSILNYNSIAYALCWEDKTTETVEYVEPYYVSGWA